MVIKLDVSNADVRPVCGSQPSCLAGG